jgi:hypothetical protein
MTRFYRITVEQDSSSSASRWPANEGVPCTSHSASVSRSPNPLKTRKPAVAARRHELWNAIAYYWVNSAQLMQPMRMILQGSCAPSGAPTQGASLPVPPGWPAAFISAIALKPRYSLYARRPYLIHATTWHSSRSPTFNKSRRRGEWWV